MDFYEWDSYVDSNAYGKAYYLQEWGALLQKIHGHRLVYLKDDKGIFPLAYVRSVIFGNRLISLPFSDYGGPCTDDLETANRLIARAEGFAEDFKVDYVEIRSPEEKYFDIFESRGYIKKCDYFTYILPLNVDISDLWDIIGKKNRNMVRKAEKCGIEVVSARTKRDLESFYHLYLGTMKKLGSPPQPYSFFELMWDMFFPGKIKILLARLGDKYLAGNLYLTYNGEVHHAYNCSTIELAGMGQNNLLQWSMIKYASQNGYKHLDFGRTREDAGNVLFKKRWGGRLNKMHYFYKFYRKALKERDEIKYKRLSRAWSAWMPYPIANKLGPIIIKQIG